MNEKFGRKITFILLNILSLGASILRFLAIIFYSPEMLFIGRILASFSTSITFQCLILCLQECSPTKLRGAMSFTSEISYSFMSLIGTFLGMDFIFGSDLRILLGFAIIPSTFAILVLIPMPETPKFLYISKGNISAAEKSILFYHGKSIDPKPILQELQIESEQDSDASKSMKEVLKTPHLRKALFLSVLATQNSVAQMSLQISSTMFLKDVNVSSSLAEWTSTIMSLAYFIGTILGFMVIEKIGRRTMFLSFASVNAICLFLYVIFAALQPKIDFLKYGCLITFIIYDLAYG
uniref:Major facilitator superfamily (MFS) profile domain-containing protein n=1 Tax=Panagrolaimus davidi TaxID=227884 RepID=A0A914Q584_9BILA